MNPPVFAHGHLRLYLLSLLEEQPRHGYELIQAMSERFEGSYAPSAGTIYPRLAKLEEEGLVTKEVRGRKTVYAITPAGREELDRRRHELDEIESNVETTLRRVADQVREGLTSATTQLREELRPFAPAAKEFGESAKRFATETAATARRQWNQQQGDGNAAGADASSGAVGESGRAATGAGNAAETGSGSGSGVGTGAGDPGDRDPRPQDAPTPRDSSSASGTGATSGTGPATATTNVEPDPDARQAEIAVETFRTDLRLVIREAERAGRLSPSVVRMLTDELARVRAQLELAVGARRPE